MQNPTPTGKATGQTLKPPYKHGQDAIAVAGDVRVDAVDLDLVVALAAPGGEGSLMSLQTWKFDSVRGCIKRDRVRQTLNVMRD